MDSDRLAHRDHALRHGRFSESSRVYLLTAVTHDHQAIFRSPAGSGNAESA